MYKLQYSFLSDKGRCRKNNEDNFAADKVMLAPASSLYEISYCSRVLRQPVFLGIFDGMGGEECGEKASFIGADYAASFDFSGNASERLQVLCWDINRKICSFADENGIRSTGTTIASILFGKKSLFVCNVGDSPVLRIRGDRVEQLSVDHVSIGIAGHKPPLSQNLGIPEDELIIKPFIKEFDYQKGDKFIICSDGLTDMVSKSRILQLSLENSNDVLASKLVNEALNEGGKDNVTVIAAEIAKSRFTLKGWN